MPTRRLFHENNAFFSSSSSFFCGSNVLQTCVIIALVLMSASAWLPVFRYAMGWDAASARAHDLREPSPGWVHAFHEPGCVGESVTLQRSADLCGQRFPSGVDAKDNIASVILVPADGAVASLELVIYGTCRIAEQPLNPMLLQIVRVQCAARPGPRTDAGTLASDATSRRPPAR